MFGIIRKIGAIFEKIFAEDKDTDELISLARSNALVQKSFTQKIKKSRWIFNDFKTFNLEYRQNIKILAIFEYRQKYIRNILWQIKYKGNKELANFLARIILPEIEDYCIRNMIDGPIIIPIPNSRRRRRERGYNQCEIIVKEIEKITQLKKRVINFSFQYDLLLKFRETPKQAKLKRQGRLDNISEKENCFKINDFYKSKDYKEKISGRNIIILDDIVTTGSTMIGAVRVLKEIGPKNIIGIAVGH